MFGFGIPHPIFALLVLAILLIVGRTDRKKQSRTSDSTVKGTTSTKYCHACGTQISFMLHSVLNVVRGKNLNQLKTNAIVLRQLYSPYSSEDLVSTNFTLDTFGAVYFTFYLVGRLCPLL
jgi:hypothetical protein